MNVTKDTLIFLVVWIIVVTFIVVNGHNAKLKENELIDTKIELLENEVNRLYNIIEELESDKLDLEVENEELVDKVRELKIKVNRGGDNRRKFLGEFEATAYTDDVESQGKWVGQTASGMKPQVGVIAVDPKIIPLGTKLIVEGYNNNEPVIAGDVGGVIKGKRLDLFMDTRSECFTWGRRKVNVWLVD